MAPSPQTPRTTADAGAADAAPTAARAGPPRTARPLAWLFGLLPVLIVAGIVAGFYRYGPDSPTPPPPGSARPADPPPDPATVREGRDYYVFVKKIELYPQRPDGRDWDGLGDSAPDIRYRLVWQGLPVYTSPARDDTLIGVWDPINLDTRQALPLLGEGKIELASTLNQGAIVNVTPGSTLTLNVWDQDTAGFGSDAAGQVVFTLTDLLEGDNTFTFPAGATNAIKRVVLGTTDTAQPVKSLVEALASPGRADGADR
jgi:hypothetical protein